MGPKPGQRAFKYVPLTDDEAARLKELFKAIPVRTIIHREWDSDEAAAFLTYVNVLARKGRTYQDMGVSIGLEQGYLNATVRRAITNLRRRQRRANKPKQSD